MLGIVSDLATDSLCGSAHGPGSAGLLLISWVAALNKRVDWDQPALSPAGAERNFAGSPKGEGM